MASEPRRLVNLPGYDDSARDIYETPDSTSPTTTNTTTTLLTQQTSPASTSETSDTSDEEESETGISRRRLHPSLARSRFGSSEVRVSRRGVDLGDRVGAGARRGYRVRRPRDGEGEEAEGLEARIARLRREVEECRVEAENELDFGGRDEGGAEGELRALGDVLAGIEVKHARGASEAAGPSAKGVRIGMGQRRVSTPGAWPEGEEDGDTDGTDEQVLRRVADFDSRLAALEQVLGISALDSATLDPLATPVLPSLTLLDQQLAALSAAGSLANLEAASARILKLKYESEQLAQSRPQSQSQSQSQSRPSTSNSARQTLDRGGEEMQSPTQGDIAKLHSLYQLLPTLQSLSPTIPPLLSRLRSLRTLHASAATAASELDGVEVRQREMESELKAWREGLEKVEEAVGEAKETNGRNGKVVEGWVAELERKMRGLVG